MHRRRLPHARKTVSKIRASARGEDCQVRIPGLCSFDPETTVYAHLRLPGDGANLKNDNRGAYACSLCHDEADFRAWNSGFTRDEIKMMFWEGVFRTTDILVRKNLMVLK